MGFIQAVPKWVLLIVGGLLSVVLLAVISMFVMCLVAQRGREILSVSEGAYRIKVVYYPGGLGTNNTLEVLAIKGLFDRPQLVWAQGADSASVRFLDSSVVEVVILNKFYLTAEQSYWHVMDSLIFDLNKDIKTRKIYSPGSG